MVTMAFFQSLCRPDERRPRRAKFFFLPPTLTVLTFSTVTPKISATACLICVFVACGLTSKAYCWATVPAIDFSVISGARMTSRALMRFSVLRGERVVGGGGQHDPGGVDDVFHVERAGMRHLDGGEVAAGPRERDAD